MTEQEWLGSDNPDLMLTYLRGNVSDRKLRLIAVASCERAKRFTPDWYHELADIAEAFAEGKATVDEMQAVYAIHGPSNDYPERNAFYDTAGPDLVETAPCLVGDLAYWIASCQVNEQGQQLGEWESEQRILHERELATTAVQVREIVGNPFRPAGLEAYWRTRDVLGVAHFISEEKAFGHLPILADALEDAGCDDPVILEHLRGPGPHVRGCWALDLILGKK